MRQGPFECEPAEAILNLYGTIDKRFSLAALLRHYLGYAEKLGLRRFLIESLTDDRFLGMIKLEGTNKASTLDR